MDGGIAPGEGACGLAESAGFGDGALGEEALGVGEEIAGAGGRRGWGRGRSRSGCRSRSRSRRKRKSR
jgi:hypothetical protein